MMHLGLGLLIVFAVYLARPMIVSETDQERIIVPVNYPEGDQNGAEKAGPPGDETRDVRQNLLNQPDLKGWALHQSNQSNPRNFLGNGDSGENAADAIMNGLGGSIGGIGKGLGGNDGGPLSPYGTPGGGGRGQGFMHLPPPENNVYRVIYILDRSGGMVSTWRSLNTEVRKEINGLKPIQSFAIVMCGTYSNLTQQTGYQTPFIVGGTKMLKAERANKDHVLAELENVKVGDGNDGTLPPFEDSFTLAFQNKPHLIYFLTDGAFDPKLLEVIAKLNKDKKVHINTIAYGGSKDDDGTDRAQYRVQLRQIAVENGGQFRHVSDDLLQ
ncbi:MAG: vWA domain-containing protein, partial [Phycisphaerae bacterium]